MKKLFFLLGAILLLVVACNPQDQNPEERRYFEGYEGIRMEWSDPDSPPRKLYYYSDVNDNTFDISLDVSNKGSSFSRGGLYLSGYDPNLIDVRGINPNLEGFGTCGFSLGNIGFGSFGVELSCDSTRVSAGGSGIEFSSDNLVSSIRRILGETGWDGTKLFGIPIDDLDVNVDINRDNLKGQIQIPVNNRTLNLEYGSRGKLMVALLSGVDFSERFGKEYLLAGDTPTFPGGDKAIVSWDANIRHFPPGLDETRQTFLVTNCYLYSTHAAPTVCIDPAPHSQGQDTCQPTRYNPTNGQGAPVAVTNIEQENTPREAIFKIHVANQGQGEVWAPGKIQKCNPYQQSRITSKDKNKVFLGQVRVSGDPAMLDCVPDRYVRLDRDTEKGYITCKYDVPYQGLQSAYQSPLVVELWYGYEETMRRTVTIKRAR